MTEWQFRVGICAKVNKFFFFFERKKSFEWKIIWICESMWWKFIDFYTFKEIFKNSHACFKYFWFKFFCINKNCTLYLRLQFFLSKWIKLSYKQCSVFLTVCATKLKSKIETAWKKNKTYGNFQYIALTFSCSYQAFPSSIFFPITHFTYQFHPRKHIDRYHMWTILKRKEEKSKNLNQSLRYDNKEKKKRNRKQIFLFFFIKSRIILSADNLFSISVLSRMMEEKSFYVIFLLLSYELLENLLSFHWVMV